MSLDGHVQFIIATHSPIIMPGKEAAIFNFARIAFKKKNTAT